MLADIVLPSGALYASIPLVGAAIAYLFRQNARSNEALARLGESVKNSSETLRTISSRTTRLENALFQIPSSPREKP